MSKNNGDVEEIPMRDLTGGETFGRAIKNAEGNLYHALIRHFTDEMNKAVKGRIITPDRMEKLYPIFREINIEMDEINTAWHREELKRARREAKLEKQINGE